MRKKIQLNSSGISFVDGAWGGFYTCSTYLVVGPHKSGKTLLGLQFAQEALNQQTVCVYFTNMRPKDLMINAASINFDLQYHMDQNRLILIRINVPGEKELEEGSDDQLSAYLQDIVSIIGQYQPGKIIFDELTPFINFNDIDRLKEIYLQTCDAIENLGVTSLFVLSEPVSLQSKNIVSLLKENSTGLIELKRKDSKEGLFCGGSITITPNIGHTEGQFKTDYQIMPKEGIVTGGFPLKDISKKYAAVARKIETQYKSLFEIDTPVENLPPVNFYNENEFKLLLNNQIAYYKSTSRIFILCSVILDDIAEAEGLLTLNQLRNAVRLSVNRKDKIALIDKRIVVLVTDEEQKVVNKLLARIKSNLPAENNEQLSRIIQYIYVYTLQVDESVNSADDMLKKVFSDDFQDKSTL